jgi:hypothetical protein
LQRLPEKHQHDTGKMNVPGEEEISSPPLARMQPLVRSGKKRDAVLPFLEFFRQNRSRNDGRHLRLPFLFPCRMV